MPRRWASMAELSWAQIQALPGFEEQALKVARHLIDVAAARADDPAAYLAWAHPKTRYPMVITEEPGERLVRVCWLGLNPVLVTMDSFVPGAEVVAMDTADLDELEVTDENEEAVSGGPSRRQRL